MSKEALQNLLYLIQKVNVKDFLFVNIKIRIMENKSELKKLMNQLAINQNKDE
tara:strand:- start:1853 stop:2011 length:159 start_codon:yes stop_codon:yes gene_type:complete